MNAKADAHLAAYAERELLKGEWPKEFTDCERCAFLQKYPGEREKGGYPKGFHQWPLERRNAWFAGFNMGCCDRRWGPGDG